MLQISRLQKSIRKATVYLNRTQQRDGSFASESKSSKTKTTKLHTTVFFNAEALYLLSQIEGIHDFHLIKHRLTQFILNQKSHDGSFNYWCRSAEKQSIPNDIDDSACAVLALIENLPIRMVARLMPPFINLIKKQYKNQRIYTWFAEGFFKEDYDIIVQLNVKAALKSLGICFPIHEPKQYLAKNWHSKSKYYVDIFFCSYIANRSSIAFDQTVLFAELSQPTTSWQLAISLVLLKQKPTTKQIEFLLNSQHSDGSWHGQAVILEGNTDAGKQTYGSSRILATLFVISVLQSYLIDYEDLKLAKLLSVISNSALPAPGTLDHYLVTMPLILLRHSTKTLRFTDYRKLALASLSGLSGLQWLNATIDRKVLSVADNTSAVRLIRFIEYNLMKTTRKEFKKFLTSSLFHQFCPPENLSYLLDYRSTYEKRVRIACTLSELVTKSFGKIFSQHFTHLLETTLIIRSISDDVHDLESDITNNLATGAVALAKDIGIKNAVLLSCTRIVRLTEKVQKQFFTKPELAPYEYRTMRVLRRSYQLAREQYLSEKVARALRLG